MTKKSSRQSMKDLIVNQATSTVDDLYAKRNALLSLEEDGQSDLSSNEDQELDTHVTYLESNSETTHTGTDSLFDSNVSIVNQSSPVINSSLVNDNSSVAEKDSLSPDIVNHSSLVENNLLDKDSTLGELNSPVNVNLSANFDLPGSNATTPAVVNLNLSDNNNRPQTDQIALTGQMDLTSQTVKPSLPVKNTPPLSGQFKFTGQNQLTIKTIQITQAVGLSGVGTLALLQSLAGVGGCYVRTRHLARELGMTYQGLLKQIDRLISAGYVVSPPGDAALGRWIEITQHGQLDLTGKLDLTTNVDSSSSKDNNKTTTTTNNELSELSFTSQLNFTGEDELISQLQFTSQRKLTTMPPWERSKLKSDAEDLFYISSIAKVEIGMLSLQTLKLYEHIAKDKGKDHAAALFMILLPKAKDNPTGYILSAFRQGAEPTASSLNIIKQMRETLECLTNCQPPEEIKKQIQEALKKDDTKTQLSLTQKLAEVKNALQLLSWNSSFETLIEAREEFINRLLT